MGCTRFAAFLYLATAKALKGGPDVEGVDPKAFLAWEVFLPQKIALGDLT